MVAIGEPARIIYTNYRGETAERTITPKRVWYGISDWHPEPQWFLTAFDHDKNADRDFALIDFGRQEPYATRELALEEHLHAIEQQLAVNLGYFHDEKRFLLETLQAHITTRIAAIRTLSSPDHADAGKVQGDGWQPIESAPKDGAPIDMWTRLGVRITDVRWVVEDRKGLRHPELAMDASDTCPLFNDGGIGRIIVFDNSERRKRICFPRFQLGKNWRCLQ